MVSIIVPAYNCGAYVGDCIKSLMSQDVASIEVIAIDDGSSDCTPEILDELARKDSRLRVFHVENGGPGRARNIGLEHALGEWILFVDADDWVDKNILSGLNLNLETAPDITFFGFKCCYENGEVEVCAPSQSDYAAVTENVISQLQKLVISKEEFFGYSVNKLYKRSIIQTHHIRFQEDLYVREDEIFALDYCRFIESIQTLNFAPYNYRFLSNSLSHDKQITYRNYFRLARVEQQLLCHYPESPFVNAFRNKLFHFYLSSITENIRFSRSELKTAIKESLCLYDAYSAYVIAPTWVKIMYQFPLKVCRKHLIRAAFSLRNKIMKNSVIPFLKFVYWGGYKCFTLKSLWFLFRLRKCGIGLIVRRGVRINAPRCVEIGERCVLDRDASIYVNAINPDVSPSLIIGNHVLIGAHSSIGCSNEIRIGDNVLLAPHVHITDRNHSFEDVSLPINRQSAVSPGPVHIGADSWLGYGVQVLPNVRIGKHCVVAAGSIVTKDTPDYSVVAGIPARVIKKYNFETSQWEKM